MKKLIIALMLITLTTGCSAPDSSKPVVKEGTTTSGTLTENTAKPGGTKPADTTSVATKPDETKPIEIKPEIGKTMVYEKFELTINSIKKAKGYDSKSEGVLVDYTFKNLEDLSISPYLGSSLNVFQDGVECEQAYYTSDADTVSQRLRNSMTEIKKGVPISCLTYFETTSQNPLTIQIQPFFNFDNDQQIKFNVDFPKDDFKATEMSPLAKLGDDEQAINDDVIDLKLGETIELPSFDMIIHGLYQAKDYEGKAGILLDYTMKNKTEKSFDIMWDTTVQLYQNGVELDTGMYSNENELISNALGGQMRTVLPGATVQCLNFYKTTGSKEIEININAMWGSKSETIMLKTAFPGEKVNVKTLSARLKEDRQKYNVEVKPLLPQAEDLSLVGQSITFDTSEIKITEVKSVTIGQGKKGLLVFYTFKNTMDENKLPAIQISFKAFQDGVEIDTAYSVNDSKYDKVSGNDSKEVQPESSIDCAVAFEYSSSSLVVLQVYPDFNLNSEDKKVLVIAP